MNKFSLFEHLKYNLSMLSIFRNKFLSSYIQSIKKADILMINFFIESLRIELKKYTPRLDIKSQTLNLNLFLGY